MLILIVVSAAIALAAFVASYEAAYLNEQSQNHARALEDLRVESISPYGTADDGGGDYALLNFTVASTDPNPTIIDGILVDGNVVTNYTVAGLDQTPSFGVGFYYSLPASGSATFGITFAQWTSATLGPVPNSFGVTGLVLPDNSYLKIDLYTALGNDFTFTALPPVPIVKVDVIPLGSTFATVLDGTGSFLPSGQNATIVSWAWTGSETTTTCVSGDMPPCTTSAPVTLQAGNWFSQPIEYGADVETQSPLAPSTSPNTFENFSLSLTVTSTSGLDGIATVLYSLYTPE